MDIILIPGFWLDASSWDEVIPSLRQAGHRVRALTLPGMESKDADRSEICEVVVRVARGEHHVAASLQGGMLEAIHVRDAGAGVTLTPREREILALIADGKAAVEIGKELHVSAATVKTHLQHAYEKLGVSDRAAAVAEALRRGLLS